MEELKTMMKSILDEKKIESLEDESFSE